ncbi:hypothetical protein SBV1_2770007 [Verrucomicrobia bacterium]|nr:hypothetical protein SBV1_2770007 [Verrucomicrobiota bacterium]
MGYFSEQLIIAEKTSFGARLRCHERSLRKDERLPAFTLIKASVPQLRPRQRQSRSLLQKLTRSFMGAKQRFQLVVQFPVSFAGVLQEWSARGWHSFQRLREQLSNVLFSFQIQPCPDLKCAFGGQFPSLGWA